MIPHMLKLAKKQSFPEDFPKPRKFRETSRNDWIFKFRVQNQVSWQKVSRKNTQYIEISQNQPNLGHFVVLGFWDSKVQKIKEVTKSTQKYPKLSHICYRDHFFNPITHGIWNDVVPWVWVIMTHTTMNPSAVFTG